MRDSEDRAANQSAAVGDDGLTDAERADSAAAYAAKAMRPIDDAERAAIARWRASRAADS